eukprot:3404137-Rhodomonas_salina.1
MIRRAAHWHHDALASQQDSPSRATRPTAPSPASKHYLGTIIRRRHLLPGPLAAPQPHSVTGIG